MSSKFTIYPFVLSGGSGTRLWPLSRKTFPKQFLKLNNEPSLLQQTCVRLGDPIFAKPTIICNNSHRFVVAEQLLEIGIDPAAIVLEPQARNTAPAALIAALMAEKTQGDTLILLLPSDHAIENIDGLIRSIKLGVSDAINGNIVTYGVKPTHPETGFGYIKTTPCSADALPVERFEEKPSSPNASAYVTSGQYLWNAGIFLCSVKTLVDAFEQFQPDILYHCRAALSNANQDLDFVRLNKSDFAQCPNIAIDIAIIENARNVVCVPLQSDWSDLGNWPSLWEKGNKNTDGNVLQGDVFVHDVQDSIVIGSERSVLGVVGLKEIVAVATRDAIVITSMDRADDVGEIVKQLEADNRAEARDHLRKYRPWGWHQRLTFGDNYQVKCLNIKPGATLSLQSHEQRAEHWVVVAGTVEVTMGNKTFLLSQNQSTYIPIDTKHRLSNPTKQTAILIEVQTGIYLGEDDIKRYNNSNEKYDDELKAKGHQRET